MRNGLCLVSATSEVGGGEVVLIEVAAHLARTSHVEVLIMDRPGELCGRLEARGIAVDHCPPATPPAQWLAGRALAGRVSAVYANGSSCVLAVASAASATGLPWVGHIYDEPPLLPGPSAAAAIEAARCHPPVLWVVPTAAVALGLRRFEGLDAVPCHVAVPVSDGQRVAQDPDPDVRARVEAARGPIILTVTRLQHYKGVEDVVDAAAVVADKAPTALWLLVGDTQFGWERHLPSLLDGCIAARVVARVLVRLGRVDEPTRRWVLDRAGLVVHAARRETFGLAMLEAMEAACPVVAAASAGARLLVDDGVTGWLVPAGDGEALGRRVAAVLPDAPTLRCAGAAARRRAADRFGPSASLHGLEAALRVALRQADALLE